MRLHLPAVPHTVTSDAFSHCAFTGKVQRFSPMLQAQGYEVVHYGVQGSASGAHTEVELLTTEEHLALLGLARYEDRGTSFIGDYAKSGHPVYRQFNYSLREALRERMEPGDVLCLPFGPAHNEAWQGLPIVEQGDVHLLETGIGYPDCVVLNRVYESHVWRHWIMGSEKRNGVSWHSHRHEWVVPNYYDLDAWTVVPHDESKVVLYFGRITSAKGCDIIPDLAAALPEYSFVLCGEGDPTPYLTRDNISYLPPVHGLARAELLARVRCTIHPSRFIEPFCGAAVEAMLCGTPVITSDFGAFVETVHHGLSGYRCRTLKQWVQAIEFADLLRAHEIRRHAASRYGMGAVGKMYAEVLQELTDA